MAKAEAKIKVTEAKAKTEVAKAEAKIEVTKAEAEVQLSGLKHLLMDRTSDLMKAEGCLHMRGIIGQCGCLRWVLLLLKLGSMWSFLCRLAEMTEKREIQDFLNTLPRTSPIPTSREDKWNLFLSQPGEDRFRDCLRK